MSEMHSFCPVTAVHNIAISTLGRVDDPSLSGADATPKKPSIKFKSDVMLLTVFKGTVSYTVTDETRKKFEEFTVTLP